MFFLAMGDLPDSWYSVIVIPAVLALLGAAVWVLGRINELKQGGSPWKWIGLLPMAAALFVGLFTTLKMRDFLYRDLIAPLGKKVEIAHYGALLIPLILALGVAGWEVFDRTMAKRES